MKVALYARVSTLDKGQETENQLVQLRSFAATQSWSIVKEYVDNCSGATDSRPAFQRMFHEAACGEFELVLFWSLDRFSRQGVLKTLEMLQRLSDLNVNWRSFTEQYLDSCGIFKDAIISIMATLAKQERLRISERTRAGMAIARAKGIHCGRPRRVSTPTTSI